MTSYVQLDTLNDTQKLIMQFISEWSHIKKKSIPRSKIIKNLQQKNIGMPTTRSALYSLLRRGYIREAVTISNSTSYVQIKSII